MPKSLKDFTREDFNTLYPLELVDHNPDWKRIFEAEKALILAQVDKEALLRIEHFGSSSIPGIKSKPYIDLIIEIPEALLFDEVLIAQFEPLGYTHWQVPAHDGIESYSSLGKGYNAEGRNEQIFHIHMCPGHNQMWQQIAFRDYLIAHPERAQAYEQLKLELVAKYAKDRGAYRNGKTEFIHETLRMLEKAPQ
ncbi:MAG: GrpB family protein [Bacteroidota bacterium]